MSNKKNVTFRQDLESSSLPLCTLPQKLSFKNMTNHSQAIEIASLRLRIDELQSKVSELQAKIRTKRKRIRRKSNQVEKRHKCDFCKKLYGSLVSLNLHLRIKHRKQKQEKDRPRQCEVRDEAVQSRE